MPTAFHWKSLASSTYRWGVLIGQRGEFNRPEKWFATRRKAEAHIDLCERCTNPALGVQYAIARFEG